MKIVKIILGITIVLLLVFLTAGLVSPSLTYETSVVINHPLNKSFEIYNNPNNLSKWMPGFISMVTIEEFPNYIGNRYKFVFENKGEEVIIFETITNYRENKLIEFEFVSGDMLKKDRIAFVLDNSTTIITNTSLVTSNSCFYKCMFAFFKGMFLSIDQDNLNKFKEFAGSQE